MRRFNFIIIILIFLGFGLMQARAVDVVGQPALVNDSSLVLWLSFDRWDNPSDLHFSWEGSDEGWYLYSGQGTATITDSWAYKGQYSLYLKGGYVYAYAKYEFDAMPYITSLKAYVKVDASNLYGNIEYSILVYNQSGNLVTSWKFTQGGTTYEGWVTLTVNDYVSRIVIRSRCIPSWTDALTIYVDESKGYYAHADVGPIVYNNGAKSEIGRYGYALSFSKGYYVKVLDFEMPYNYTITYWAKAGNSWHFYAFENNKSYCDLTEGSYTKYYSYNSTTSELIIGNTSVMIDDFRIYNRTLDLTELRAIYSIKAFLFKLVDENAGDDVDISKLDYVRMYVNGNLTYDFTENGATDVLYYINGSDEISFDIKYPDTTNTIQRYLLSDLLENGLVKIGIPDYPNMVIYEQLIYSATKKPIIVVNMLTGTITAADYTKFIYGDAYMVPAYTTSGCQYYLYTYDASGNKILLGTIDGGRASQINLDVLQYASKQYTVTILTEDISISKVSNKTLMIYYKNLRNDNIQLEIQILDGDKTLFDHTETSNPNEVTLYFDYSTLNITNNMLKLRLIEIKQDGSEKVVERYFTLDGASGIIHPALGIFLSLTIAVFGITIAATRHVFGYVGIITIVAALAISTLAVSTWYVKLTQAILLILGAFIFLVYKNEYVGVR